jgi:hypothetical protein
VTIDDFIARFRSLHAKAKSGALTPTERPEYERSRDELGRLLLVAQQVSQTGKTLRTALRIAQLVKVEIDFGGTLEKTSTMDLASGGFAALLQGGQRLGRAAQITLHVPGAPGGGTQAIKCSAKVASSRQQGALHRVSFTFDALSPADREILEVAIIDYVLRRFAAPA